MAYTSIYRPATLRQFLRQIGCRPSKRLSQNFVIDRHILDKTCQLAAISDADVILEIGAGPGALTEQLLQRGATVIAIEKDRTLARWLQRFQTGRLQIIAADALQLDYNKILPPAVLKVVANPPYATAIPLLQKLLRCRHHFHSFTLMLAKEMVQRIVALPGCKQFSSLSLLVQYFCRCHRPLPVAARCFFPAPAIDSALIRLDLRSDRHLTADSPFFRLTRCAFQQRRKTLINALKPLAAPATTGAILAQMGQPATIRGEQLPLSDWLQLYAALPS